MNYKDLGKSTLKISEIGFGCMSLGEDQPENTRLINRALHLGVNFFDTADLYQHGQNEAIVGRILKDKRNDVVISTKVGNQWRKDGSGWDWNPGKQYILTAVDESLRRLQTDYIDLYQLHGGTLEDPIDEIIEAFEMLQQQGKIRFYGISSIRPNVIREYLNRSAIVSVMMQYSLLDRRPEESCLGLLEEKKVGVLARGSLAKGLLVNKPPAAYLNYTPAEVERAAIAVRAVSGEDRTSAQTAIQFALHHPAVSCAVVGFSKAAQLEDVVKTTNPPSLSPADLDVLRTCLPENQYTEHR